MEHEQKRHEKHEEERKQRQAEERQSEQRFSLPGPRKSVREETDT